MIKWAAGGVVAILLAAAFFLPEWLSTVHDAQLLDSLSIQLQNADQEGFAESLQLTVAEKVLLMRTGSLSVTELDREEVSGLFVSISGSKEPSPSLADVEDGELADYFQEAAQRWEQRLEAVKQEIRSLQSAGGLPSLWSAEGEMSYAGSGELLYMDPDTRLNFQVYRMSLKCEAYTMNVTVDVQSGRILTFSLQWDRAAGAAPAWRRMAQLLGAGLGRQRLVQRVQPGHIGARGQEPGKHGRLRRPRPDCLFLRRPVGGGPSFFLVLRGARLRNQLEYLTCCISEKMRRIFLEETAWAGCGFPPGNVKC